MGRMIYLHAYVAAHATPEVSQDINGPTVAVDADEYNKDPLGVEQKIVDDFVHWLRGEPEALREHTKVDAGVGGKYESNESIKLTVNQYKQQSRHGRHIAKKEGLSVSITQKMRVIVQDIKTGRFVSPKRLGL